MGGLIAKERSLPDNKELVKIKELSIFLTGLIKVDLLHFCIKFCQHIIFPKARPAAKCANIIQNRT